MKPLKAVILAGGTGSRLMPLTKNTNKHLLEVGGEPMIYKAIRQLTDTGIKDVLIVTGPEHLDQMKESTGRGDRFHCTLEYAVQPKPAGIADALARAKAFIGTENCAVLLGDNLFSESLIPFVENFRKQRAGARVLIKEVPDPERFGVAVTKGSSILEIVEKPKNPKSNKAVVGLYFYDHQVWDAITQQKPSARGELEITDVNNYYVHKSQCEFDEIRGAWFDAGTLESLKEADDFFKRNG